MMIGHADALLDFGSLNLSDGAASFGNVIDLGKADVNGMSVQVAVDGATGGTSATFSIEGSTDNSTFTEIAASPAVALADLSDGVNIAIPRDISYTFLKVKIKAVAGTFTAGTAHAYLDTYVGK